MKSQVLHQTIRCNQTDHIAQFDSNWPHCRFIVPNDVVPELHYSLQALVRSNLNLSTYLESC